MDQIKIDTPKIRIDMEKMGTAVNGMLTAESIVEKGAWVTIYNERVKAIEAQLNAYDACQLKLIKEDAPQDAPVEVGEEAPAEQKEETGNQPNPNTEVTEEAPDMVKEE